jgi:hypothetical protein
VDPALYQGNKSLLSRITDNVNFAKIAPPQQLGSNGNEHVDFGANPTVDYINCSDYGCTNRIRSDANGPLTKARMVLSTYLSKLAMTSISNTMAPT